MKHYCKKYFGQKKIFVFFALQNVAFSTCCSRSKGHVTGLRDVTKRQCKNLTRFAASRQLTANIEAESPIYDTLRRDFSVRPLASIIQNGASNYRGYHRSHAKIFVRELHFLGVVQVIRLLPPHPHPPPPPSSTH